jgi:hypothetical protein
MNPYGDVPAANPSPWPRGSDYELYPQDCDYLDGDSFRAFSLAMDELGCYDADVPADPARLFFDALNG